jgi:hypothetical protein
MRNVAVVFAVLFSLGVFGSACLPNTCFIKVCNNGVCTCPVNSCTEGADYNLETNLCECVEGRLAVQGQCMTQEGANAFCGKGFTYGANGCEAQTCPEGQTRDEASGTCKATSEVAENLGVEVGEGEKLSCPEGSTLVIEGSSGACVPNDQTCARDEAWIGDKCAKLASCPTGSAYDTAKGQCVAYASTGDNAQIDIQKWADTNYGPNGGNGAGSFCNQFARRPWSFGVPQGQSATVQVAISMAFPGQAVNQGTVSTEPSYVNNDTPVPPKGREAVQASATDLFAALKAGGGKASVAQLSTVVKCRVVNAAKPVVVPAAGGF